MHKPDAWLALFLSLVVQLLAPAQLGAPVMRGVSAAGSFGINRRKISDRKVRSLNPIAQVHSLSFARYYDRRLMAISAKSAAPRRGGTFPLPTAAHFPQTPFHHAKGGRPRVPAADAGSGGGFPRRT